MTSRRLFLGSLAAAGAGGVGAASLLDLDFRVSAQPAASSPLLLEIRGQIKDALGQMRDGQSVGARQLATTLRIYASTVNDAQLRATLGKANRQQIVLTEMNHSELLHQAEELGINPASLPPHAIDRSGREAALNQLIQEGLSPLMRHVADFVDSLGAKMERVERSGRARPLQVALRQPIPDSYQCGTCEQEKAQVENALQVMTVVCAASLIFPFMVELCAAASATYLVFYSAYAVCSAIVAFCEAYNH